MEQDILRSRQDPKILGRDDAEVVGYGVAIEVPRPGHLLAQECQDRAAEIGPFPTALSPAAIWAGKGRLEPLLERHVVPTAHYDGRPGLTDGRFRQVLRGRQAAELPRTIILSSLEM